MAREAPRDARRFFSHTPAAGMSPRPRALPYAVLAPAGGYLYYVASRIEFHERAGTLGPGWRRSSRSRCR